MYMSCTEPVTAPTCHALLQTARRCANVGTKFLCLARSLFTAPHRHCCGRHLHLLRILLRLAAERGLASDGALRPLRYLLLARHAVALLPLCAAMHCT